MTKKTPNTAPVRRSNAKIFAVVTAQTGQTVYTLPCKSKNYLAAPAHERPRTEGFASDSGADRMQFPFNLTVHSVHQVARGPYGRRKWQLAASV